MVNLFIHFFRIFKQAGTTENKITYSETKKSNRPGKGYYKKWIRNRIYNEAGMVNTEEDGHEACKAIPPWQKQIERCRRRFKKNLGEVSIIGFFDESAPQTTANTVRLWSFGKPEIINHLSLNWIHLFFCHENTILISKIMYIKGIPHDNISLDTSLFLPWKCNTYKCNNVSK